MKKDTVEDYYMKEDLFLIHIEKEVNPGRVKAGLNPIGDSEARACYRVLCDFFKAWAKETA